MSQRTTCFSVAVLVLGLAGAAIAAEEQRIEYGKKSDLHGVKIVFVDTGRNIEFRENVVNLLTRELPEVTVSDRLDKDVDIILQFAISGSGDGKGAANLLVIARPTAPNSVRIIAKYEDAKTSIWTAKLSSVLTHRFIRDYLTINPRPLK